MSAFRTKHVSSKSPPPPNPDGNHTETIETTAEIAGCVIVQGASRIRRIKAKHQVQITTIKEGNKRKFQIEGRRQNTQKARQEISRITSETARRDRKKVQEETRPPQIQDSMQVLPKRVLQDGQTVPIPTLTGTPDGGVTKNTERTRKR